GRRETKTRKCGTKWREALKGRRETGWLGRLRDEEGDQVIDLFLGEVDGGHLGGGAHGGRVAQPLPQELFVTPVDGKGRPDGDALTGVLQLAVNVAGGTAAAEEERPP